MPLSGGRSSFARAGSECRIAPRVSWSRSPTTEWIRVWEYEVSAYERMGWRLSHVRRGFPSEALLGPGYADCLMMREVTHG
jgi:hypothetical protein